MTDTTKGDISATTALTATGDNDAQTPGQSRDVVVYGSEQQRGVTLALWRLDEKLEIIRSETPHFACIVGKHDDDFDGCVAVFEDVLPGNYQLEVDVLIMPLSRVTVKSRKEKSLYTEVDVSTLNIPIPNGVEKLLEVERRISKMNNDLGGEYRSYSHDFNVIRRNLGEILKLLDQGMRGERATNE